ncbi:MarR family winged helix-turn-helix transcriptional regulator [Bradyrhizobium manausense]
MSEAITRLGTLNIEDRYGIRMTDMRILALLHSGDKLSVGEISRRARVDKAWISRLARELEEKGLVKRVPDPDDSRAMLVSLTRQGRELQTSLLPQSKEREKSLLRGIDRRKLVELLTKLDENMVAMLEDSGLSPEHKSHD